MGRAPTRLPGADTRAALSACLSQLREDTTPHPFPPCFRKSNTKGEHVSDRGGLYVHSVPVAQPSAVPATPGVHLSSGCQGQVVVTVRMGSNFDNVSGDKTLDELWGLKGEQEDDD